MNLHYRSECLTGYDYILASVFDSSSRFLLMAPSHRRSVALSSLVDVQKYYIAAASDSMGILGPGNVRKGAF